MNFGWDASSEKSWWEHPDGEIQQAIGYLEGVLRSDSRTDVKFDHQIYRSDVLEG